MGLFKVNLKEINEYLKEFETLNNNIRRYLLENESKILKKIILLDNLCDKHIKN